MRCRSEVQRLLDFGGSATTVVETTYKLTSGAEQLATEAQWGRTAHGLLVGKGDSRPSRWSTKGHDSEI